jgi:heat-inducible transcriptional repressor
MTAGRRVLDDRKALVLRAIVSHYVRTGEPVASKTLVEGYKLRVSPATVRNDMVALEEAGFLYQPHTSAGRIPTDAGYRYFVDSWAADVRLPATDSQRIRRFFGEPRWELEDSLRQTASLLSNVTHHAAVVFAPALDRSTVRHVELVRLATGRAMIVLVADTGRVENHMLAVPEATSDAELDALAARLNEIAVGSPLESVAGLVEKDLGSLPEHVRGVASDIVRTLRAEHDSREAERVFLEGASNIVDEQNFADLETVRQVISALEHRRLVLEVLADALGSNQVSVRIGSENPLAEMQYCSVITAPYGTEENALGSIGVVGPTRMDYRRTIAAVYEVSAHLGRMLTELGM